jgi:hypothetical protein
MSVRTLSLLAALAASSPFVSAQVQVFAGEQFSDAWTSELAAAGAFGRSAAGELTGNSAPEAVVLDGPRAVVLVDADTAFAPVVATLDADDVAILSGHAFDGRGVVAFVGSGGLTLATLAAGSGTLSTSASGLSAWSGALRVRAANLDGSGRSDLVGVASDGQTLLLAASASGELAFSSLGSFVALGTVLDLVPLQWTAGGAQELAVLTSAGVFVHSTSGALLASYASALPGGTIARIAQSGTSTDRIAWTTAYSTTLGQSLYTLSPGGIDGELELDPFDVVSSQGADFDGDGDDDLMYSHRFSYQLVYVENLRSAQNPYAESFTLDATTVIYEVGPDGSAPENVAWPAVADYDLDGDLDLVFACERGQQVRYVRGDRIDHGARQPRFVSATYASAGGSLSVQLAAPATAPAPGASLVVDVWRQATLADPLEQDGIARVVVPWPTSWPASIDLPIPEGNDHFYAVYSLEARAGYEVSPGMFDDFAPAAVGCFAVDTATVGELEAMEGAATAIEVASSLPEASEIRASIVRRGRKCRYPEGQPPVPAGAP